MVMSSIVILSSPDHLVYKLYYSKPNYCNLVTPRLDLVLRKSVLRQSQSDGELVEYLQFCTKVPPINYNSL